MSERFAHMPEVLAEIAEVAGAEAAWELAGAVGGTYIHITSRRMPDGHWLVELLGREAADKISEHFAGDNARVRLLIPMARNTQRRQRLVKALEAGMTASEAALSSGMHVRTAHRARRRLRRIPDEEQGDLF